MKPYTVAQLFACNQWLSDWPEDMSYDELIYELKNDVWIGSDSDVCAWEIVADCTGETIARFIEDTRMAFESAVADIREAA